MWGEISKVQHLVAIRPLTLQPPKTRQRVPREDSLQPLSKPLLYDVNGRSGRHYEFDGDSFMSIEPLEDSVAINWSTALPIATVVERLDSKLVDAVESCLVFDPIQRAHREIESGSWYEDLRAGQVDYPFVRLESKDLVLVWQRPAYPSHVDEDVTAGRIGVISAAVDAAAMSDLVRSTATPIVGDHAEALIADARAAIAAKNDR